MLTLSGSAIVSIGTIWLSAYFGFVVHKVPNIDLKKIVVLVAVFGTFGTILVSFLLITVCVSALPLILRDAELTQPFSTANIMALVSRRPRVDWGAFSYYVALSLLLTFILSFSSSLDKWLKISPYITEAILILLAAGLPVFFASMISKCKPGERRIDLVRTYIHTSLLWCACFVIVCLVAYAVRLGHLPDNVMTAVPLAFIPSIGALLALEVSIRVSAPLVLALLMYLVPSFTPWLLGTAARLINIGYAYFEVTALTNSSAQALLDCGYMPEKLPKPRKFYPHSATRHFKVFVLSSVGDDYYIVRCDDHRAIELPRSELRQATVFL